MEDDTAEPGKGPWKAAQTFNLVFMIGTRKEDQLKS